MKLAPLVIAALGVLNFVWGFLPSFGSGGDVSDAVPRSVYAVGPSFLPILLLAAGLLALAAVLPHTERRVQFPTAVVTAAATIGIIVIGFITGGTIDVLAATGGVAPSRGIGLILLLIFGLLQTVAAVGWWLLDAGIIRPAPAGAPVGAGYAAAAPSPAAFPPAPGPVAPPPATDGQHAVTPAGHGPIGPGTADDDNPEQTQQLRF